MRAEADEKDALDKIAEMPTEDRIIAETLHAIVGANAPDLAAEDASHSKPSAKTETHH